MNKRPGYSVLGWDLPTVLKDRLEAEAREVELSAAALLARILRERYGVPREELPVRPKPGPKKPKGKAESAAVEASPKKKREKKT